MKQAPIPKNEKERLVSLHKLGLLDTKPEERFDRITRTATKIFHVPISTLTLVDAKREWFKSCQGLPDREGDRAISFCGHALLVNEIFVISDAKKDVRFSDNPMVIGKPYIRFYAGVPIMNADGQRVGVFCIKDTKPRTFLKNDKEILAGLAAWAELEVNSRNLSLALAEQKKLQEKLKQADKLKDEFISTASHQLRTPLTNVQWVAERLLKKETLSERGREYVGDIMTSAKNLSLLVDTMLNVSRLDAGKVSARPELINLVDFIQDLIDECAPICDKKNLKVSFHHSTKPVNAKTDKGAFRNIVQALLSNAIEYTLDQGTIEVVLEVVPQRFVLTVRDNGIGIPKKEQNSFLFQKFHRASNAQKVKPDGTGLGLYIVKQAVKLLSGEIWFESKEGKGSIFYVELPLESEEIKGHKLLS